MSSPGALIVPTLCVPGGILDSHAAAHFAGLDPWWPQPPGASAIRNFRNLLRREMLLDEILIEIFAVLNLAGAFFQPGTIIEPVIRKRSGKAGASTLNPRRHIQGGGVNLYDAPTTDRLSCVVIFLRAGVWDGGYQKRRDII